MVRTSLLPAWIWSGSRTAVLQLDGDNRRQALARILAGEIRVVGLEDVVLAAVVVDHAGQRHVEARQMRAASGVWMLLTNAKMFSE